jgi:hypothetical protein
MIYFPGLTLFAPRHAGQTLVPFPWQLMHGRCIAVLLGCLPCPRQTGQAMEPFPLHSGQGIITPFSVLTMKDLLSYSIYYSNEPN